MSWPIFPLGTFGKTKVSNTLAHPINASSLIADTRMMEAALIRDSLAMSADFAAATVSSADKGVAPAKQAKTGPSLAISVGLLSMQ